MVFKYTESAGWKLFIEMMSVYSSPALFLGRESAMPWYLHHNHHMHICGCSRGSGDSAGWAGECDYCSHRYTRSSYGTLDSREESLSTTETGILSCA